MDRSFLSQANVIEASRKFVCIRLATYEDAQEAEFLKTIFSGRTGALENTVFCLLSPDGKTRLSRSGRSPDFAFRTPAEMASSMNRIADQYRALATTAADDLQLPLVKDVRLALNVAACDHQPLIVLLGQDRQTLNSLKSRMTPLAWSDEFIGQYQYVATQDRAALSDIDDLSIDSGIVILQPGQFGRGGTVFAELPLDADDETLTDAMSFSILLKRRQALSTREHISAGVRAGVKWQTAIPVTDPNSIAADRRRPRPGR